MIGAFVALNLAFAEWVSSSGLPAHPVDIQTRAIFDARLDWFFEEANDRAPTVVFLGDSVVFGYKLRDTEGDGWDVLTLPARYSAMTGESALNLGVNGVLFSDLDCVVREVLLRRVDRLVINVSPRPFAADFARTDNASERSFLCAQPSPAQGLARWVPLLAHRDLWQFRWLGMSPRQFFADAIAAHVQPKDPFEGDDDELDLSEILWKTKASNRLNTVDVDESHVQSRDLDALLGTLASHPETEILLLYLEEDVRTLGEQLDVERYEVEQKRFVDRLSKSAAEAPHITFVHAESAAFEGLYDDHVHLTARGYEKLARIVRDAFEGRSESDPVD